MKRFVLHNENSINDIQTYKDHFGDYLYTQFSNYENIIEELKDRQIFTRDIYKRSLYDIIVSNMNKDNKEKILLINGYTLDYLVFKDKFLLKNNPYIILDSAILLSKILNIKNIDIILRSYYKEEKNIIIKALAETEDAYDIEVNINIYDENSYNHKITISYLENFEYIFDLETITQFGYFVRVGKNNFEKYGGTFLLSISGDINMPNLYEFESNISFKDIVRMAGNIPIDHDIKCVFTSGFLNPPIDIESLYSISLNYKDFERLNINLGNGGICFIRDDRCIIRVALKIAQFSKSVSYGESMPCYYGFRSCEYYLNRIILGKSDKKDLMELKNTAKMIIKGSSCLYTRMLAECIYKTTEKFNDEFIYAIENKITLYSFIK